MSVPPDSYWAASATDPVGPDWVDQLPDVPEPADGDWAAKVQAAATADAVRRLRATTQAREVLRREQRH